MPGSTMGIFPCRKRFPVVTMVWVVSRFRLKAPPGISSSCISPLTSSGQRSRASWASQPQKSATLSPQAGGKQRKFARTCGGIGEGMFPSLFCIFFVLYRDFFIFSSFSVYIPLCNLFHLYFSPHLFSATVRFARSKTFRKAPPPWQDLKAKLARYFPRDFTRAPPTTYTAQLCLSTSQGHDIWLSPVYFTTGFLQSRKQITITPSNLIFTLSAYMQRTMELYLLFLK